MTQLAKAGVTAVSLDLIPQDAARGPSRWTR